MAHAPTQSDPEYARLPRGRHGLSREQVEQSQQERMLRAMSEAVGELGYVKTTVAEVLRRAGVSRETFYANYKDKHDCFMQAFDRAADELVQRTRAAAEDAKAAGGTTDDVVSRMLMSFLELVAEEPEIARTYYVEVYAAGQEAVERRVAIQMAQADTVMGLIDFKEEQRFLVQVAMASLGAVVTQFVSLGQTEHVTSVHGQLLEFLRATFRGADIPLDVPARPAA